MPLVDYLLLTPLDEEWRAIRDALLLHSYPVERTFEDDSATYYLWQHSLPEGDAYLVVGASIGAMGTDAAASFVTRALARWRPRQVVLLGIAGSVVGSSLPLGHVIIPREIFGYVCSKAHDTGRSPSDYKFTFRQTGHKSSSRLVGRLRGILNSALSHSQWQQRCLKFWPFSGDTAEPPRVHIDEGDVLASGNVVHQSRSFAKEIKMQIDHRIKAVDMEAKGFFQAIHEFDDNVSPLMIRGVSDYADRAKSRLEKQTKNAWRTYAAANAARLLSTLLDRRPTSPISPPCELCTEVDPESFLLCNEIGTAMRHNGAQHLVFPNLIRRNAPTPELELTVRVSATALGRMRGKVMISVGDDGLSSLDPSELGEHGEIRFTIPRCERPQTVGLYLSLRSPTDEVAVTCKDEFGRIARNSWKAGKNAVPFS